MPGNGTVRHGTALVFSWLKPMEKHRKPWENPWQMRENRTPKEMGGIPAGSGKEKKHHNMFEGNLGNVVKNW